jgi:4-amino-4-deoxy-L-arabinose transferase-like glycosyltransferase
LTVLDGVVVPAPRRLRSVGVLGSRRLLIELALVLSLTGVAAVAFGRSLHAATVWDEGVYLGSLDALEHGQKLGSEVFASQPPGFYLLLEAERALFGGSVVAMRVGMLLLALVGCLCAYYIGRCIAGPRGGFLAFALLATPSRVEDEAIRVRADLPSVTLSLMAIALALFAARRRGTPGLVAAGLAGVALASAVSIKLLAVPVVIPVLAFVLGRHERRLAVAFGTGAAAVAVALVSLYGDVLGPLWSEVVGFHLEAQTAPVRGTPRDLGGNLAKVVGTLADFHGPRSPFPWLVLAGAAGTVLAWRRRQILDAFWLWLWAAAVSAFLIYHRPLWAHDVVMLTASLAVASGVGLAALLGHSRLLPRMVASGSVLLIAATLAHHLSEVPRGESRGVEWAAAVLRSRTPPGSEVASDLPIVPFLADRRQPGALVDTSWTRLDSGSITEADFLHTIERERLSAVVVGHNFAGDPTLRRILKGRFPVVLRKEGVSLPGEGPHEVRIFLPAQS